MTGPFEGEIWFEAHADTRHVEPELERGVRRAAEDAEHSEDYRKAGRSIGNEVSKGVGDEIPRGVHRQRKEIARGIASELEEEEVKVRLKYKYVKDRRTGQIFRKAFYEDIKDDIEGAVEDAFNGLGRKGGIFDNFTQGLKDATGSVFNVSGKSPLAGLLIPLFGALIDLIAGALQLLIPVGALLAEILGFLIAIGAQAAVLFVVFKSLIPVVQAAFAAQNAKELAKALDGLPKPMQDFVRALLPLKNIIKDLKTIIELRFFQGIGTDIKNVIKAFDPILRAGFWDVALKLGDVFRKIIDYLGTPQFQQFVRLIFGATAFWLRDFGTGMVFLLRGLTTIGTALMPFMTEFGSLISQLLMNVGDWLSTFAKSPEFKDFLFSAKETAKLLFDLLYSLLDFASQLLQDLDEAGGKDTLKGITDNIKTFTSFLETKTAKDSLHEWLVILDMLFQAALGLLAILLLTGYAIRALGFFFQAIGQGAVDFVLWIGKKVKEFWDFITGVKNSIRKLPQEFRDAIVDAFKNAGTILVDAGKALVDGLIDGIKARLPRLAAVAATAIQVVSDFFPHSPAKKGPFSGEGYSYYRGQALVADFAAGMDSQAGTLNQVSNSTMGAINFGPGSIRIGFQGALPSTDQARMTGSAVGDGILTSLASRSTRLAVRTL